MQGKVPYLCIFLQMLDYQRVAPFVALKAPLMNDKSLLIEAGTRVYFA